ncbi:MAG: DEAD/DEAH box helicase [Planctomycetota bacterium]
MTDQDTGSEDAESTSEARGEGATGDEESKPKKKRRRRRRGKKKPSGEQAAEQADEVASEDDESDDDEAEFHADDAGAALQPRTFDPSIFDVEQSFADLGLPEEILGVLKSKGYEHPTLIQAKLLPVALTGADVLGQAKTGTGKTAAFCIPMLSRIKKGEKFSGLVLAPTRELAVQIADEMRELGSKTGLKVATVYGGQKIQTQADRLAKGPEIIVGTPGRVQDMVQRGYLSFDYVKFAVLDEVDRMFDIGFRDDIRRILGQCPDDRQTVFVSATISEEIEKLARKHMEKPEKIVTSSGSLTVSMVEQHYLAVNPWDKRRLLTHLLKHEEPALTVVFCRLKKSVDRVAEHLSKKGIEAIAIHGDMRQGKRNSVMTQLKGGRLSVLVASDLASRGIDADGVSHVINYDLPDDPDLYVHRIGRTARAGRQGVAWSFVCPDEGPLLTQIENLINAEVPKMEYPDFEASERPEGWKDEKPSNVYVVEGVERKEKNRYAAPEVPAADTMSDKDMAAKFPGGIVPSKLPPKRMGGRAKTRGR